MKYVCLPTEWQNYIYRAISPQKLQAELHRVTIVDTSLTEHGIAIRVKLSDDPGGPAHEKIIHIYAKNETVFAEMADMEKDRLPGHPMNEIGGADL